MTIEQFERELKQNAVRCDALAEEIRGGERTCERIYPLIRRYVFLKFMLFDAAETSDDILELAQRSVETIAQLKKGGLKFTDHSGTCGSVSSAVTKKILLLLALQRALGIQFEKHEAADIDTISQLTRHAVDHMAGAN